MAATSLQLLRSEAAVSVRAQIFGGQDAFFLPWLLQIVQSPPETYAQLPAMWLGMGGGVPTAATVLRAKIDENTLQFTVQVFPWNLQVLSRVRVPR